MCSCSCTLCIRYTSLIACRVENRAQERAPGANHEGWWRRRERRRAARSGPSGHGKFGIVPTPFSVLCGTMYRTIVTLCRGSATDGSSLYSSVQLTQPNSVRIYAATLTLLALSSRKRTLSSMSRSIRGGTRAVARRCACSQRERDLAQSRSKICSPLASPSRRAARSISRRSAARSTRCSPSEDAIRLRKPCRLGAASR
jgi:hypothetical protein